MTHRPASIHQTPSLSGFVLRVLWPFLVAALALVTLPGCAEDVTAVLDVDRTYTMYGYLDPTADTQAVRIFPVDPVLREQPGAPLEATLRSVDLITGEEHVWRDSVVQYANGTFGNVYWAEFRPAFERAYRLQLVDAAGATVHARVDVPGPVTADVGEFYRTNPEEWPADMRIPVSWHGGPGEIVRTDVHYRVAYAFPVEPGCLELRSGTVVVASSSAPVRTASGWEVEVRLTDEVPRISERLRAERLTTSSSSGFVLLTMEMEVFVGDTAWVPPGGLFDEETLADPMVFTNVTNGFGFVGAGYRRRVELPFSLEIPALAGVVPPEEYLSEGNACRE